MTPSEEHLRIKELKQQFKADGVDEAYICSTLLPALGLYSIDHTTIGFQVEPLPKGMGLDSRLYTLDVYRKNVDKNLPFIAAFVVKDFLPSTQSDDLLHDIPPRPGERRDRNVYEVKYLRAFSRDLFVAQQRQKRRIFLKAFDGSLDALLQKDIEQLREADQQKSEEGENVRQNILHRWRSYTEDVLLDIVRINKEGAAKRSEFEQGAYSIKRSGGAERYAKKLRHALKQVLLWYKRHDLPHHISIHEFEQLPDLDQELTSMASCIAQEQTIIHGDARSANVLYRNRIPVQTGFMRNKRAHGLEEHIHMPIERLDLIFCDFASAQLGPCALDLTTFLHDYYLVQLGISDKQKRELFEQMMMEMYDFWEPSMHQHNLDLDNYIRHDFNISSSYTLVKGLRNHVLLEIEQPTTYQQFIQHYPQEINTAYVPARVQLLSEILADTNEFPALNTFFHGLLPTTPLIIEENSNPQTCEEQSPRRPSQVAAVLRKLGRLWSPKRKQNPHSRRSH